ncbi:TetR/AcrR family transcriptional regulator [Leptospira idonii]|uniref:TetR/AcrR family transcriptional regulator n=1 Tax=Leptospira idonii TaxID=1193500 RepID=A0A4R9LTH7_9LEPT|nr:TetR/AcrR family transcriptional regulator [Leptospira idonii]TGN16924.1 TetR/AcrR family transcriptional regulator [Leptospira idonii]
MKRNRTQTPNTKEKLLQEALDLFYKQGYPNTGINQLLENSGVFRKSFYLHFSGKEELGIEYLKVQDKEYIGYMRNMMRRYPDANDFIPAWCRILIRKMKNKEFVGCPFANFTLQTLGQSKPFEDTVKEIMQRWKKEISVYFEKASYSGKSWKSKNPDELALKFLACYQGWVQLSMTMGDTKLLFQLSDELEQLVEPYYA